jgi:hypothetical protein
VIEPTFGRGSGLLPCVIQVLALAPAALRSRLADGLVDRLADGSQTIRRQTAASLVELGGAVTAALVLLCAAGVGAAEGNAEPAGLEEAFKKFARAVADDNPDEVVKHIAPPGDKAWVSMAAMQAAAAKYETALDQKLGKGDERSPLEAFLKRELPKRLYEARGTIREVQATGKDRALVTVWTRGPRFGNDADRIYERKFAAAKVDGQWKFELPPAGGRRLGRRQKGPADGSRRQGRRGVRGARPQGQPRREEVGGAEA